MTRATATLKINVLSASGIPAWYSSQASGTWKNFGGPTQLLDSSGVMLTPTWPSGGTNRADVIRAWSGGVLNTAGLYVAGSFVPGTWLVIWGGGHGNYAGNEVYGFGPLEAATPRWQRITDPTSPAPIDVPRIGAYPVARHTYDTLAYLSSENKMLAFGAPGYANLGYSFDTCDVFDFGVDPYSVTPWSAAQTMPNGNGSIGSVCAYNPVTNKAWRVGTGNGRVMYSYDVATGALTGYSKDAPFMLGASSYNAAAIIPASNILVICDYQGILRCQNLNTPNDNFYTPATSGSAPTGNVVLKWDAANNRFVAKAAQGGKQLWFLAPGSPPTAGGGTWTWTSVNPASGDTPPANSQSPSGDYGYYGRFQVVSGLLRGVIAVSDWDQTPSFYKF